MSESPEQTTRPAGDDGPKYLSNLLLAGSLPLLFTPALWIFSIWKWVYLPFAAVALLALSGWWLARRRGWDAQKRQARLLGLSLLCCLAGTLLESFREGIHFFGFGVDDVPASLFGYVWLLQLLFGTVSMYLLHRSFGLLPGRCERTTDIVPSGSRPMSGAPAQATPPVRKSRFWSVSCLLLTACVLFVCIPPQRTGLPGERLFLTVFTLVGCVAIVLLGSRPAPAGPDRTSCPAGKNDSRFISCLLLTACGLLFCIPLLCVNMSWESAFLPLAPAALLTLVSWCLARRRGCAREEAQALFFQRTLLYGLAIFLLPACQPEIELTGGGMGRVFDALDHLDLYALRLGIWVLQLVLATNAYTRLLWSVIAALTRRPPEFRFPANYLMQFAGSMLLVFALLGGIIINTEFCSP